MAVKYQCTLRNKLAELNQCYPIKLLRTMKRVD